MSGIRWHNRFAAWLWDLCGNRVVELATPVWAAEWNGEPEDDDPDQRAMESAYDSGMERGYELGRREAEESRYSDW